MIFNSSESEIPRNLQSSGFLYTTSKKENHLSADQRTIGLKMYPMVRMYDFKELTSRQCNRGCLASAVHPLAHAAIVIYLCK